MKAWGVIPSHTMWSVWMLVYKRLGRTEILHFQVFRSCEIGYQSLSNISSHPLSFITRSKQRWESEVSLVALIYTIFKANSIWKFHTHLMSSWRMWSNLFSTFSAKFICSVCTKKYNLFVTLQFVCSRIGSIYTAGQADGDVCSVIALFSETGAMLILIQSLT